MRHPKNLAWDVVALIAILLCVDTCAQLFFKIGMMQLGELSIYSVAQVHRYGINLATNPFIISGVFALVIAFFSWLSLISKVELSFAQPMTSLVFVTIPLSAAWLLNEPLHISQCIGISLIVLGVFVVSDDGLSRRD